MIIYDHLHDAGKAIDQRYSEHIQVRTITNMLGKRQKEVIAGDIRKPRKKNAGSKSKMLQSINYVSTKDREAGVYYFVTPNSFRSPRSKTRKTSASYLNTKKTGKTSEGGRPL